MSRSHLLQEELKHIKIPVVLGDDMKSRSEERLEEEQQLRLRAEKNLMIEKEQRILVESDLRRQIEYWVGVLTSCTLLTRGMYKG